MRRMPRIGGLWGRGGFLGPATLSTGLCNVRHSHSPPRIAAALPTPLLLLVGSLAAPVPCPPAPPAPHTSLPSSSRSDYLRFWHGLWHMFVAASFHFFWKIDRFGFGPGVNFRPGESKDRWP